MPVVIAGGALVFILLLALVKKHIFEISMKGAGFGFVLGVIVILALDLIVIFGVSDKEKLKGLSSQETRQEAISEVLVSGLGNINKVLGASSVKVTKTTKQQPIEDVLAGFMTLSDSDATKVKELLCPR